MNISKGQKVAATTTIITLALALVKGIIGYFTGSLVLVADAFHSGVDVIAKFASWFGLKIASRKASDTFPYGFYRAETLAALLVSVIIIYMAISILIEGIHKFLLPPEIEYTQLALSASLASATVAFFISRWEAKTAKTINSSSLKANADESRMDIYSSLVVFVTIILTSYHIPYIEGIITILLSILILIIGIKNGRIAIYGLMDAITDKNLKNNMENLLSNIEGVKEIKELKIRQSGPFLFGEVHISVDPVIDVERAHDISEHLEQEAKKAFPQLEFLTVHIEPYKGEIKKVLIPTSSEGGLNAKVEQHFGRAPAFTIVYLNKGKIISYETIKNPFLKKPERAGLAAAKELTKYGIDALIVKRIGEISFHTLKGHFIDIYNSKGDTVKEVIDNLLNGKLALLVAPTHSSEKEE